jgi:hypothetical protein
MLTSGERNRIFDMERRLIQLRTFLAERPLPVPEDAPAWYDYLAALKEIQGNAHNDVSFAATLMAKIHLQAKFHSALFDAAEKAQGAPGLDIDPRLPVRRRLVAEIKTTLPYNPDDLGAQQKATFERDFSKLRSAKADVKIFFLTERRTFELMRKAKYRSRLAGVTVVLLPQGEEMSA